MDKNKIRNFAIIAHIDHGKSTLADRMLELTKTVEMRDMKEQLLDQLDLERERGITIKLAPVRMYWEQVSRTNAEKTQNNADNTRTGAEVTQTNSESKLLYEDLTYKIRGAVFEVKKQLGLGHKESVYQQALEKEFALRNIPFEKEKSINIEYKDEKVGTYRPDFIIGEKIIIELKALPFIGVNEKKQVWTYLKGSPYKLLLLVNFSPADLNIERIIYDSVRTPQDSALVQRESALEIPRDSASSPHSSAFMLNLIDTPGHVDFSYEVSRSLAAVEGAILLVDAAQGIEAQTLSTLYVALENNLTIIPVVNKIDLAAAKPDEVAEEIIHLLGCTKEDILFASGKTGQGVPEILDEIINRIPAPTGGDSEPTRALIFDSIYDPYRGVVAYLRMVSGQIKKDDEFILMQSGSGGRVEETGIFTPKLKPVTPLLAGEIGYLVTGFRSVSEASVGDTVTLKNQPADSPLPGYKKVKPFVYASVYSVDRDKYVELKGAIEKLKLNDASLEFEPEQSEMLGHGFRCGFLGLLHLDIVKERLEREFDLDLIVTSPTVVYTVFNQDGSEELIGRPSDFQPASFYQKILEPWVELEVISPKEFIGSIMELSQNKRAVYKNTEYLDDNRVILKYMMPLSELIVGYYDQLKSVSRGFASINYEFSDYQETKLEKVDILIAGEKVDALSFVVFEPKAQKEAKRIVERLKELIPKQNFEVKIQAAINANIIASERISAMRKDVTAKLYGGDVTRKNKLLDKQKKGKKKMKQIGRVNIPSDVFIKVLKNSE